MTPQKISKKILPKVAQTPYPKSQTIRNHVSYVKIRVIIISARGGPPRPPPVGDRVNLTQKEEIGSNKLGCIRVKTQLS